MAFEVSPCRAPIVLARAPWKPAENSRPAYHRHYREPYPVYAAPSYWVTDWMVAGSVADRDATVVSVEPSREEARLAREEAQQALQVAQQVKDAAEIAEARAAQATAETRAARAEAEDARRRQQADSGKPNPKATPIDPATRTRSGIKWRTPSPKRRPSPAP